MMQQAVDLDPANITLHTQLALNQWSAGNPQQAQQTLKKLVSEGKENDQVDLALAVMYLRQDNLISNGWSEPPRHKTS